MARIAHLSEQVNRFPVGKSEVIRSSWGEFLGRYKWDVFATLTWAKPTSAEVAVRNFGRWLWLWQRDTAVERGGAWGVWVQHMRTVRPGDGREWRVRCGGCEYCREHGGQVEQLHGPWANAYRKGRGHPVWALGIESHRSGALHAHGMIRWSSGLPDLRRTAGWRLWFDAYGRNRLEPPRSQEDVVRYCSKYVVKHGDIYLSPGFNAARMRGDGKSHRLN